MPDVFEKATAALEVAQEGLDKLTETSALVSDKLNTAQALVTSLESKLAELSETGFGVIVLSPAKGSWVTRLQNANDAPENNNSMFSCGYINLTVSATESGALGAYNAMKDAMEKKFKEPELSPSVPEQANLISVPEVDLPLDKWESLSVGDLFPGVLGTIEGALNNAKTALKSIENTHNKITEKMSKLGDARDEAATIIAGLEGTGQYQLALSPAMGGWMTRAQSEIDAPPEGGDWYTTGFAAVAIAADLPTAEELFDKLATVM